jgi:predicted RNA-binding Zn-ribbon protein involved in translation (DUF1610 family)
MASVCFLAYALVAAPVIPLLVASFVTSRPELALDALRCGGAAILLWIFYGLFASGVPCPLCHARVIAKNRCALNRRAKRSFGSHRLRVAIGVLLLNRFRCPYCGELAEVRARRRGVARPRRRR